MNRLFYVGLEPYESRYTHQLQEWNQLVFNERNIRYQIINGDTLNDSRAINTGSVLDTHNRCYYSLLQNAELVKLLSENKITNNDVIFYEDMFTPGIEALPYIFKQNDIYPKVYVRCLAQSIDPDDFINREGMFDWMRHYEYLIDHFVSGILVASEEMVSFLRIAGFKAPIYVTGLPFGKAEVLSRIPNVKPIKERTKRISYAARWDDEKNPDFFMDLMEMFNYDKYNFEFAILTGNTSLKSNNQLLLNRLDYLMSKNKNIKIYDGLQKNQYYELLADSYVLFNCALQDWVSNTVSEADTFNTITLYPAYRSFPETFFNNEHQLYVPWSIDDALTKLYNIIEAPNTYHTGAISNWQDQTINRTLDVFQGKGEDLARNTLDYRKHVARNILYRRYI